VSDKRLLERCGNGKGYLIETRSASVRPSGLRTRRAGDWTKGLRVQDVRQIDENRKRSFKIRSQGTENEWLRSQIIWNCYNILREIGTSAWMTLHPGSPVARWEKRKAGRFCYKRHYPKVKGCRNGPCAQRRSRSE